VCKKIERKHVIYMYSSKLHRLYIFILTYRICTNEQSVLYNDYTVIKEQLKLQREAISMVYNLKITTLGFDHKIVYNVRPNSITLYIICRTSCYVCRMLYIIIIHRKLHLVHGMVYTVHSHPVYTFTCTYALIS
jgi:hypothetical protein